MSHNVEIKTFFIAKSKVVESEVNDWLGYLKANEFNLDLENKTDAEALIELAGRRCYMSFQPNLNPNVKKIRNDITEYIDNIMKSAHGSVLEHYYFTFAIEGVSRVFCYLPNTKILTKSGWKYISELSQNDFILTKNPSTGIDMWSEIKKIHKFDYSGNIYYWKNREKYGPIMTKDHKLWTAIYTKRKNSDIPISKIPVINYEKIEVQKAFGKKLILDSKINYTSDAVIDDDFIKIGKYKYNSEYLFEWLGLLATDGTISNDISKRNRMVINQTKKNVISRIRILNKNLFLERFKEWGTKYKYFCISDKYLRDWCISKIGINNVNRNIFPIFNYSDRLIKKFIDGALLGDGVHNKKTKHLSIITETQKTAEDYQSLLSRIGISSKVYIELPNNKIRYLNGKLIKSTKPHYYCSINRRGNGKYIIKKPHQYIEKYNGPVYCPETENGLVFVKNENGEAVWCGNTGEMNRHRAGWAISEGSMRYIRFEDIGWWMPPSMVVKDTDDEVVKNAKLKTQDIFNKAFSQMEENYKELLDTWNLDGQNFHYKKTMTSLFRRIIGMGVATGGVWTGNIRALRHVLTMRTTTAAEEEICFVFSNIMKKIKDLEPILFGDFVQDEFGFWSPKYLKI